MIVEAAITAPSAENCQPFCYSWDGNTLDIHYSHQPTHHFLNQQNFGSTLAFGCTLEIIDLKAQEIGYVTQTQLTSYVGTPEDQLWARIQFIKSDNVEAHPLLPWLTKRFTSRERFLPGSKSYTQTEEDNLKKLNRHQSAVKITMKKPQINEVDPIITEIDSLIWKYSFFAKDFLKNMRFSKTEAMKSQDGMYWKDLGIGLFDVFILRILNFFPFMTTPLWYLGGRRVTELLTRYNIENCSGLVFLTVSQLDTHSVVSAGRESLKAWLQLQSWGYVVQPYSSFSLIFSDFAKNITTLNKYELDLQKKIQSKFPQLKQYLNLAESEMPIWCLRFGQPTNIKTERLYLRHSLQKVFRYK